MDEITNLADEMEKRLPAELVSFIKSAGQIAAGKGERLYLVGGVVRDLLLGQTNLDIDLVVEGDAIALARQLIENKPGKITVHQRFSTAKLQYREWSIDLATARSETYVKPGALPIVKPGSLSDDLFRRDFTINAMAIELNPDGYGRLIDLYSGQNDLKHKFLRVLHEKSFIDDSTRIWRGLRYEQRLDFQLEPDTLRLLKRDIPMLATISGDRIRHELECILHEESPEKVIKRADELKVLPGLHPSLKGNGWLAERFAMARKLCSPTPPPISLYLALLAYPLTGEETEQLISYLRLPKQQAQTLRDSNSIKARLSSLANPRLRPSGIYRILHIFSPQAITANLLASDSPVACRHIRLFLKKLRYIKPILTGNDLMKMGVYPPNLYIKEILHRLQEARLDGTVTNKRGEVEFAKEWLAEYGINI